MSNEQPLVIDYIDWTKFMPSPPVLTSFQSGWSGIQLAHYRQSWIDVPEISNAQHILIIPLGHTPVDLELVLEGRLQTVSYQEKDFANPLIEVFPTGLPYRLRSHSTLKVMEWIQCGIDPAFLAQIAYESVDLDRVELLLTMKKADPLIYQIGLALKSSLEEHQIGNRFYAESMATALSAHLLRYYSTRTHQFRDHEDGLSRQKLKQAIEYMQAHLGENLSLNAIASELGMSQYYFCHLFKRSTGLSPHQYLVHQRIEHAKHLLRQSKQTITAIALECGFANQSHFAKYFRQCTGMNPKEFRNS